MSQHQIPNRMQVLLAEEDMASARILTEVLTWFGCDVARASSCHEAICHAIRTAPDIVISSMKLHDCTAEELAREIRMLFIGRSPRFIALRAPSESYDLGMYAEFSHIVEKPTDFELLRRIIARYEPFV